MYRWTEFSRFSFQERKNFQIAVTKNCDTYISNCDYRFIIIETKNSPIQHVFAVTEILKTNRKTENSTVSNEYEKIISYFSRK